MTVTYYTSSDTSAPVLNDVQGALYALLLAVLVNGYGAKAAAGWTNPYTGTAGQSGVFKQGGGNGFYLNVNDTAATGTATYAQAIGASGATAYGVANLTNPFPTTAQVSGGVFWPRFPYSSATSPSRWAVIATNKTFYMWNEGDGTNNGSQKYQQVFWFGDMDSFVGSDAHFTQIMGNTTGAQRTMTYTAMGADSVGLYCEAAYNGTTVQIAQGMMSDYYKNGSQAIMGGTTSAASSIQYPNPEDGALYLSYIYTQEHATGGNSVRGFMPGIWNPDSYVIGGLFNAFDTIPSMAADALNGKTFHFFPLSNTGTLNGGIVFETSNTWG